MITKSIFSFKQKIISFLVVITLLFSLFSSSALVFANFSDVNETTKYYQAIEFLKNNDVVGGYPDGTFKPEQTLNRAELLKILIEATVEDKIDESKYKNCFPDVKEEWFAKYVCYGKEKGIVNGYPDGTFKPGNEVNFVEAAKMVVNTMKIETKEVETNAPWFKKYTLALEENEHIPSAIISFDQMLNRGEIAEIIYRTNTNPKQELETTSNKLFSKKKLDNSPVLQKFVTKTEDNTILSDTKEYRERKTPSETTTRYDDESEGTMPTSVSSDYDYDGDDDEDYDGDDDEDYDGDDDEDIEADEAISEESKTDLKGGEINDNELFEKYQEYVISATKGSGYDINLSQRFLIKIKGKNNNSIFGKDISITDNLGNNYKLKTDTDGSIYFYPSVYLIEKVLVDKECSSRIWIDNSLQTCEKENIYSGFYYAPALNECLQESRSVCNTPYYFKDKESCIEKCQKYGTQIQDKIPSHFTVLVDDIEYEFISSQDIWEIQTKQIENNNDNLVLDLVFTLDTTGSMSDQINKLKETISNISEKVTSMSVQPKIRYALVVYRDRSDQYLTRIYDFTENLNEFQKRLNSITASGGGDYKEDLNTALFDTLENLSWSQGKNTLRTSFLITDAPPHMDYDQKYDYQTAMLRALELGVKFFPLASSGLDNTEGEFIFRQIALITNAKYVFITNSRGGTDYHVSEQDYSVQSLDQLIINLIQKEFEQIELLSDSDEIMPTQKTGTLKGSVSLLSGNCMPCTENCSRSCNEEEVKRNIYIRELTSVHNVNDLAEKIYFLFLI